MEQDGIGRLLGRMVKAVKLNDDRTQIRFEFYDGPIEFSCFADCCSESWIHHISGINALKDEIVRGVEEVDMPTLEEGQAGFSGRQECDSVMMIKLKTAKGVCDIEFRNSSNGYYGGSLDAMPPTDGSGMTTVSEDF